MDEINSDIEEFMEGLSERFHKENDLSDILSILFGKFEGFRKLFLDFVGWKGVYEGVEIAREHRDRATSGRPDLVITNINHAAIIEAKLWDKDYHFDKYDCIREIDGRETESRILLTTTANVPQSIPPDWAVKYWESLREICEGNPDSIIRGFGRYIRRVIMEPELRKIEYKNLTGLLYLNRFRGHSKPPAKGDGKKRSLIRYDIYNYKT